MIKEQIDFLRNLDPSSLNADDREIYTTVAEITDDYTDVDWAEEQVQDVYNIISTAYPELVGGGAEKEEKEVEEKPKKNPKRGGTKPPKPPRGSNGQGSDDIKDQLYEILSNITGKNGAPIDEEEVQAIVEAMLKKYRVNYEQLSDELKKMLSQVQIIKYQTPSGSTTPSFSKPNIPAFQKIVDDVVMGVNTFLIGGAGTGKTYLAGLVAKALGLKYVTINCSQWTSPTEIIGGQTLDGYQEGKMIEAWRDGKLLILDEMPKLDPNTAGLLNETLAKTNKFKNKDAIIFNSRNESFKKHDDFAVIATGNIYPNSEDVAYAANNKQDLSLLDRFSGSVYWIQKNPKLEKSICAEGIGEKYGMMVWNTCNQLREVIETNSYEAQVSIRLMETARDTLAQELDRMKGNSGVDANEGKTFKDVINSFIEAGFNEIQQDNLRKAVSWGSAINGYAYRK